jgi:hypothetical protein
MGPSGNSAAFERERVMTRTNEIAGYGGPHRAVRLPLAPGRRHHPVLRATARRSTHRRLWAGVRSSEEIALDLRFYPLRQAALVAAGPQRRRLGMVGDSPSLSRTAHAEINGNCDTRSMIGLRRKSGFCSFQIITSQTQILCCSVGIYEVDPMLRTTGSGFLSETAAVRSSQ